LMIRGAATSIGPTIATIIVTKPGKDPTNCEQVRT
jgi:hypothetical protein